MIIFHMIEIMVTWLECMIGILLVSKLVVDKETKWKYSIITSCVIASIAFTINQFKLFSVIASLIGILGIAFSVKIIYKAKLEDCLILSAAYLLIIYIIDFLSISFWGIIFQNEQFGLNVIQEYSIWRIVHIILTKVILYAFYLFMTRVLISKIQPIVRKMWTGIIVVGILVAYAGALTIKETDMQSLMVWSFLVAMVIFGSYSGIQYIHYCKTKEEIKLAEERNRMLAENYEKLISDYRDNQIYHHDLKNHYLIVQRLIKNGDIERAEHYIDSIDDMKTTPHSKTWTGISILDILLEYKMNEACKDKIYFAISADKIQLKLTDQEIVALFGNALDNAIDACRKVKNGTPWIQISIRKVSEMTFIKITNAVERLPDIKEKKFLSTKTANKEFGWGMTSMQLIVEKYEGIIGTDYIHGFFQLSISFFC